MRTTRILRQLHVSPIQYATGMEMFRKAFFTGDIKRAFIPAGQVVGIIEDIPTCRELMERTVTEAEQIIKNLYDNCLVNEE